MLDLPHLTQISQSILSFSEAQIICRDCTGNLQNHRIPCIVLEHKVHWIIEIQWNIDHKIYIKILDITKKNRYHVVDCFKLCPRVLKSSKRETNGNRKKSRQRQWGSGERGGAHSLSRRIILGNPWELCYMLVPWGLQPCGHATFLPKTLQRLPRVIRKPSQRSLPSAPSHLSKLIYYPFPLYAFLQPLGPSVLSKCNYLVPSFGFCTSCCCVCSQPSPPSPTSPTSCLHRIRTFFSLLLFAFCLDIIFSEASDNDHLKILLVNCFKCTLALIPCISFITIQKGLIFIFVNLMSILPNLDDKSHESRGLICLMSWHTDSSKCVRYSWHSINNRIFVIRDWGNTMQNSFLREKEGNSVNERRENVQIKIHFSHLIVCHSYLYGQLIIPTNSQEWFIYHQSAF